MTVSKRSPDAIYKKKYEGRYCIYDNLYVSDTPEPANCQICGRPAELMDVSARERPPAASLQPALQALVAADPVAPDRGRVCRDHRTDDEPLRVQRPCQAHPLERHALIIAGCQTTRAPD